MKPLKLKINAFGPYSGYEEVDFRKLNNIYLITGQTGAGKTTIFDGISFALFGKTSGSERDTKELKSDFASEEEISYVELKFMLNGKEYTIRREPTQSVKGRKTKREHNATLYLPDGKILNKINEIDGSKGKIQELLGINVDQFRQIVMLPQGEFKKLIESSTEDKEIIFRKIFSSKIYKDFQDKLKEKSANMKREIEKYRDRRELLIKKINPGENSTLSEKLRSENLNIREIIDETKLQIESDSLKTTSIKEEKDKLKLSIEALTKQIEKAKEINLKFNKLNNINEKYNSLLAEEEIYKAYSGRIVNGKKAREVYTYEKSLKETESLLDKKNIEKLHAIKNLEFCERDVLEKRENLKNEEKLSKEREELERRLHHLESLIESFKEYEEKEKLFKEEEKQLASKEEELKLKINKFQENEVELEKINKIIESNETLNVEILNLQNLFKEGSENIILLRELYKNVGDFKGEVENHKKLSNDYEVISNDYIEKLKNYEVSSEELKKQQAGILASFLKEGEPCIVCGSTTHPNKAKVLDKSLTEEKINLLKEEVDLVRMKKEELLQEVSFLSSKIETTKESILKDIKRFINTEINLEDIDKVQEDIKLKGTELNNNLSELKKSLTEKEDKLKDIQAKREEKEKRFKSKDLLDSEIKLLENSVKESYGRYTSLKEAVKSLKEKFKEVASLKELKDIIKNTKIYIDNIDSTIKRFRDEEKSSTINLASAKKNLENKISEVKDGEEIKNVKEKEFLEKLGEAGFDKVSYSNSLIELEDINILEEKVNTYRENLLKCKEEIKILTNDIKGEKVVDVEEKEKEKSMLSETLDLVENNEKVIYSRNTVNKDIVESIEDISTDIKDKEDIYGRVANISNLANGNNSKKITFERYVLAHHFNEILLAANIRFKSMTNERYFLERKIDITDGRRGQGLDFNVYDNYTGKVRSIKSLSGGESFKASLSLALGLSDVIEENTGGVRIDAMFIDEGFGTLDPESLEKAIETIIEIGGEGKVIGVISHVAELKERISSKIEVKKGKSGSSISILE